MTKHLFLAIVMMVAATAVLSAQENKGPVFADTLYINTNDDYRLMIVSKNIARYEPADTLQRLLLKASADLMSIELPDFGDRFMRIYYGLDKDGNAKMRFEEVTGDSRQYLVLENGETLPPLPVELILKQGEDTRLHCYVEDVMAVEDLAQEDLTRVIREVIEKQTETHLWSKRVAVTSRWKVTDGITGNEPRQLYRNTQIGDQIELSGSVNASLIRNTLVPSIDLVLGVSLARKTVLKHMFNFDFSMNYIFNKIPEGGYNTDINTFMGGSWYINTSSHRDNPKWYGLGVGYLVWRNGDFFDKDTWRLTLGARFGKHYSVMPELYFGNNFKNVMPGLKFRFSF